MIHLNIEGKSWPEVTEQLANLVRETVRPSPEESDLRDELAEARSNLNRSASIIQGLRDDLEASRRRIVDLEQLLADEQEGDAENPTPAAASTASEQTATASDTAQGPAMDQSTTSEPEQPKYDKVQVKEFLAGCREKGVNITDVLKPFGGRFPAVKEEDYPALMEAAKKALADKEAK